MTPVQACARCPRSAQNCAGSCPCTVDTKDITLHQARRYCPLARYGEGSDAKPAGWDELPEAAMPPAPVPGEAPDDWSSRGPAMWAELHRRPLESQGDDAAWLEAFARRISCGDCREHWRSWVAANLPPEPLTFEWTWRAHRAVSERLGKPSPTFEEARAYWGF